MFLFVFDEVHGLDGNKANKAIDVPGFDPWSDCCQLTKKRGFAK
jgi:hypothetical protein